ncbi:Spy/CpxP family protein refolding chaperone [Flavobacterium sp.]|jgi:protein CpxP|uniref:Spy/CpxP family protein refolding chaperone n=1 Tax=Flavobacterium sp. TaxID=239 RepID=UPI0037BE4DEB
MKKLIVTIVLVISSLSFAQENSKLSPQQQTELQVKKMTLDLDLDTKQQNELKTILLEQNKKRATKIAELKDKKKQGVKLSVDEKFDLKSKMLDDKIEHKARMKKILKPEQFQKWEKHQENRKKNDQKKSKQKRQKKG